MRRMVVAALMAVMLMTLGIGSAAADPVNNPNATFFEITCNGETYDIVTTSGNPGHILGSTSNIVPFQFTFMAIDPETDEVLFSETETVGNGQRKGVEGDLVTCTTTPQTFEDPEFGELTVVVEVEAFITPRGR